MSARSAAAQVLKGASQARTFASTSAARLPPKPNSAAARFAKAKQQAKGEEDGAAAGGSGNVLAEVTLPKPDLSSLPVMHPESLSKTAIGEVRAFPGPAMEAFKALSIPGPLQREHAFTPRPATVVREATLKVTKTLDAGKKGESKAARYVLSGGAGSGKSTLLLQAVSYAQSTDWVVLYLPSAAPLVNSSTPHIYSSARALFDQPALSASLLSKFSSANKKAFKELKTSKDWSFGDKKVPAGKSLEDLTKAAGGDEKLVTSVFEAVIEELAAQKQRPVLLAIDDAQPLFTTSHYVDPSYHSIETFSLAVPRLLLEFISGQRSFAQGSILLSPCALSKNSSPAMTDFLSTTSSSSPAASSPLSSPYDHKTASSYETYKVILDSGVQKLEVPERLSRQEAVGIVRLLKGWRGTREAIDDKMFLQRLVATDGNPREFARSLIKTPAL